ncbi:zinc ribbon domain-containing protein [bacterium]|nr:zinc ribbon domain-containing protein [bacterium]
MPIEFRCVNCQATYEVSNDLADRSVKCRECGVRCRVGPAPLPAAPEPRPAISNEPAYFRAALGFAENICQVVQFLVAVAVVGCIILLISGLATRHAFEAVVVVVLTGIQLYFVNIGSKLMLSLVRVLVGIGRDVRVARLRSADQ